MHTKREQNKEAVTAANLIRERRGDMPRQDFAAKFGIRYGTLVNWEQGKNVPKLDAAVSFMRALGYNGLKELGFNLGDLLDVIRGDPTFGRAQAFHALDEILAYCPETMKERVVTDLIRRAGDCTKARKE